MSSEIAINQSLFEALEKHPLLLWVAAPTENLRKKLDNIKSQLKQWVKQPEAFREWGPYKGQQIATEKYFPPSFSHPKGEGMSKVFAGYLRSLRYERTHHSHRVVWIESLETMLFDKENIVCLLEFLDFEQPQDRFTIVAPLSPKSDLEKQIPLMFDHPLVTYLKTPSED